MIDLRKYYLENIREDNYYYRFYDLVRDVNKAYNVFVGENETKAFQFTVFDEIDAIEKFKSLCQPDRNLICNEDKCWFYLVSYYLNSRGYIIEQFPNVLSRPPMDPSNFTYSEIKNKALALGLDTGGTVRWATRRKIVAELNFTRKASCVAIGEALDKKIQLISAGNSSFEDMQVDEKLREIANLIEHLLKVDGKFIQPDYSTVTLGYIDDVQVKKLRKQLQCFRHSSAEAIRERSALSEEQKGFLVDFGVTACKAIYALSQ